MNTLKVKHHRNSDTKNRTTVLERSVMIYWGLKLVLRAQPHPQFLQWYTTFSWLFGLQDNPLTRRRIITVNGLTPQYSEEAKTRTQQIQRAA